MYYGFDIGGTKIAFAVYDGGLNLCHEERMSTPGNDYEGLLQLILTRVEAADARFGAKGAVGIGFPGIINRLDGSRVHADFKQITASIIADLVGEIFQFDPLIIRQYYQLRRQPAA